MYEEKSLVADSSSWRMPLFHQKIWMDIVCPKGNWDQIKVSDREGNKAIFSFQIRKKFGLKILEHPPLTPFLGAYFSIIHDKQRDINNKIVQLSSSLLEQIPQAAKCNLNLSPETCNILPFIWAGYDVSVKYTYRIDNTHNIDKVVEGFSQTKRREMNRNIKAGSEVRKNFVSMESFFRMHSLALREKGEVISYDQDMLLRLEKLDPKKKIHTIFSVHNLNGDVEASLLLVNDSFVSYQLISVFPPKYLNSGASSLIVKEAIADTLAHGRIFDFEGSMIKNVEKSFRQFGGQITPYFVLRKVQKFLKW